MLNRIIAIVVFVLCHILYYLVFRSFLSGVPFALAVYGCTLVTFVILDVFLVRLKHSKRGSKHEFIDKE